MTANAHRNLDDLIFGYDKDVKIMILDKGRMWFELCDGRVGQEHEIEKAVSNLLQTIQEANRLVGGKGYIGDFDYMLSREMSERPDLLLSDKPKIEAAICSRLREVLPGFEVLGHGVDLGLALTVYGQIAHKNGRPKPTPNTIVERLREKLVDKISFQTVMDEYVNAVAVYSTVFNSGQLDCDAFRNENLQKDLHCVYNALLEFEGKIEDLTVLKDFQAELEVRNIHSFSLSG